MLRSGLEHRSGYYWPIWQVRSEPEYFQPCDSLMVYGVAVSAGVLRPQSSRRLSTGPQRLEVQVEHASCAQTSRAVFRAAS